MFASVSFFMAVAEIFVQLQSVHLNPWASHNTFFPNSSVAIYSFNPFFQSLCKESLCWQCCRGKVRRRRLGSSARRAHGKHSVRSGDLLFSTEIYRSYFAVCGEAFFKSSKANAKLQHCTPCPLSGQGRCRCHLRSWQAACRKGKGAA